jgi:TRAP-type mannitol/chloroaromatic compound transport system permease small subunit
VAVLYLQLAYTLRTGRMTRSDAFHFRLIHRRPRIGHATSLLFHLAGAALALAIMIGAWPKWLTAWREGFYVGIIGVFSFPEWPLLLIIFCGCALLLLQFALLAVVDAMSMRDPKASGRTELH